MKIIILGAGRTGAAVAANLAHEFNDLTVIDTDPEVLQEIQEHHDIATVCGNAAHPNTLRQAGAETAQMLIAVTNSDETNMIACQVAHALFSIDKKIARIRNEAYLDVKNLLFSQQNLPIDVVIAPEEDVTHFIYDLVLHPGAHQVLSFAGGLVNLVEMRASAESLIVGASVHEIGERVKDVAARAAAIYRHGELIIPKADTIVEANDRIFFVAPAKDINKVLTTLLDNNKLNKRIMIVGGGRVGFSLAKALEQKIQVKVIEKDHERARQIAEKLDHTIVLCGDAADEDLLIDENIDRVDMFCALTDDDEVNILSAMLAKRLGANKVLSLVDRSAYMEMVDTGAIDHAVFPQHTTIGQILTHVRQEKISTVHSILRGMAEAFEAVATGTPETSKIVGRTISEIYMPKGAVIISVVRDRDILAARSSVKIQDGDHIIIFVTEKASIPAVEALFYCEESASILSFG